MASPFEVSREQREQHLKERQPAPPERPTQLENADPLDLAARKRTRQTYTVYLDRELMGRAQRVAKQRGVSASAVVEACMKKALEQLEG